MNQKIANQPPDFGVVFHNQNCRLGHRHVGNVGQSNGVGKSSRRAVTNCYVASTNRQQTSCAVEIALTSSGQGLRTVGLTPSAAGSRGEPTHEEASCHLCDCRSPVCSRRCRCQCRLAQWVDFGPTRHHDVFRVAILRRRRLLVSRQCHQPLRRHDIASGSSTCSGGTCSGSGVVTGPAAARSRTTGRSHADAAQRLSEAITVASR
jgi:hypothetical protein